MPPTMPSSQVDRSAEDVFAYVTDPSHFPEWQAGVISGQPEASDRLHVGARCVDYRYIGLADRCGRRSRSVVTIAATSDRSTCSVLWKLALPGRAG